MRDSFLLICALQILQKLDVIYAGINVKLEVLPFSEKYEGESVLVLHATTAGDNRWILEITSFDAEQSDFSQLPIYFDSVHQYPNEDHPMYKEAQESRLMKNGIRKSARRKFKSVFQRHKNNGYEILPKTCTRTVLFTIDIIKAILDLKGNGNKILTFTWKKSEQPALYAETLATGKIPSWMELEHYTQTPSFHTMDENNKANCMIGPIFPTATYSIGNVNGLTGEGEPPASRVEYPIRGLQTLCFEFAKVISEVPPDIYETMEAHLSMLMGPKGSYACDDKDLELMPSIKFGSALSRQVYEFTSQEYMVKMPAKEGEPETSRGNCYMAIVASNAPGEWVLGATFVNRYTLEIANLNRRGEKIIRAYVFTPHQTSQPGF